MSATERRGVNRRPEDIYRKAIEDIRDFAIFMSDPDGKLIGFSKVMRDMTERNKLTEERDRFFALSMDMLSIVYLNGRFQRINPAFQQVLGFSEEELMGMSLFELVHPDDRPDTERGYESL